MDNGKGGVSEFWEIRPVNIKAYTEPIYNIHELIELKFSNGAPFLSNDVYFTG